MLPSSGGIEPASWLPSNCLQKLVIRLLYLARFFFQFYLHQDAGTCKLQWTHICNSHRFQLGHASKLLREGSRYAISLERPVVKQECWIKHTWILLTKLWEQCKAYRLKTGRSAHEAGIGPWMKLRDKSLQEMQTMFSWFDCQKNIKKFR